MAQTQVLAPQMRQSLKMLQMTALDLAAELRQQMQENPVIEDIRNPAETLLSNVAPDDRADKSAADLDVELFRTRIAPALSITKRFVGEEPFSPTTRAYNERMKQLLPESGIELIEIPRFDAISASRVRALIREGKPECTQDLVPETTYEAILRYVSRNA